MCLCLPVSSLYFKAKNDALGKCEEKGLRLETVSHEIMLGNRRASRNEGYFVCLYRSKTKTGGMKVLDFFFLVGVFGDYLGNGEIKVVSYSY